MSVRGMNSFTTSSILSTVMFLVVTSQQSRATYRCDPLVSDTVDISCQLYGASVDCTESVLSGTIASVACKSGYSTDVHPGYKTIACVFGSWEEELFSCVGTSNRIGIDVINADICGQTVTNPAITERLNFFDDDGETEDSREFVPSGTEITELYQMPWMALLVYRTKLDRLKYYCSGSVINERYVLTSARCVTFLKSTDTLKAVRLGDHDYGKAIDCAVIGGEQTCAAPPVDIPISRIIPHPEYNRLTLENDIALLELQSGIDFSKDSVKPICLPVGKPETRRVFTNEMMSVAGWGLANRVNSTILYKRDQPIVSNSECIRRHPATRSRPLVVTNKQLCYGGRVAEDSCHGDNGGPIVTNGLGDLEFKTVQYGIRSYHPGCNYSTEPSVATKVGPYMDWIISVISA